VSVRNSLARSEKVWVVFTLKNKPILSACLSRSEAMILSRFIAALEEKQKRVTQINTPKTPVKF